MKEFRATTDLAKYLGFLGFRKLFVLSEKLYYVNGKGKQIVLDIGLGIRLLDKIGNTVWRGESITPKELGNYIKSPA